MSDDHEFVYEVKGLERHYRLPDGSRLDVLKGLDLALRPGELVLIEGTSGIGKTTLLHLMGLLDRPDGGSLILDGVDHAHSSKEARAKARSQDIGFVFQFFHLLPEFSALENVLMAGRVKHGLFAWSRAKKEARERGMELLESMGIGARADHRPSQLSGGERQRVALARALFNRPAVLLCDEPTGNLDVKTSTQIHDLLVTLNEEQGQTMVIVTHDPTLSERTRRVVRLEDGRALERGVDSVFSE